MGDTFYLKQSDTSPVLEATLEDGEGSPVDLDGASVDFQLSEPRNGSQVLDESATVHDGDNGVVRYDWASSDTDTPGRFQGEFVVTYADGAVETFPNVGYYDIIISE
jgi:hypothetical protein